MMKNKTLSQTPSEEEIKWRRKMLSGAWTETKKDT